MAKELTEKQKKIKEQFYADRGKWKWNETWETILHLNENILSSYSRMSSVPHKKGYIDLKTKELIYVAIDNAITHYYTPGMKSHLKHGIVDLGATKEELMEVFAIASTLGIQTYLTGVPILVDQLKQYGTDIEILELTDEQKRLKELFIKENEFWSYNFESILKLDTEMFECYIDYLRASAMEGILDPKTREFIYIAVNASPTALNSESIKIHIN